MTYLLAVVLSGTTLTTVRLETHVNTPVPSSTIAPSRVTNTPADALTDRLERKLANEQNADCKRMITHLLTNVIPKHFKGDKEAEIVALSVIVENVVSNGYATYSAFTKDLYNRYISVHHPTPPTRFSPIGERLAAQVQPELDRLRGVRL